MVKRAFNVVIDDDTELKKYINNNVDNASSLKKFKELIDKLLSSSVVDGDSLSQLLFQLDDVDAFVSYSHKDYQLARMFAAYLESFFGLNVFLDCNTWKSSDELLRIIDDKYCKDINRNTYIYEKRNISTGHVHSMLSTAIFKQISKSKLVFFLNTPNSVPTVNSSFNGVNSTNSPWIYEEIVYTDTLLEIQKKFEPINENKGTFESGININRKLPMNNFTTLQWKDFVLLQHKKQTSTNPVSIFINYKK